MKETIKINLNAQLFDLDKDAYERLKRYLDSLELKFGKGTENAKEIIEDIESRIAELLNQKLTINKQVVSLTDITEIIEKLGTADEMGTPEENTETQSKSEFSDEAAANPRKRIYRDIDHSIIGGVAAGLANYFGIDSVWVRILFIVFTFFNLALIPFFHLSGIGLIAYLILWIIVPPARTTAQKLEMEGKPVNIDTIYESVNKEFGKVKTGMKNYSGSQEFRNTESALREIIRIFGQILLVFVKVIGAIIGVTLVIVLIFIFLSIIFGGFSIASLGIFDHFNFPELWNWQSLSLIAICTILVIFIPIIGISIKFIRWVFGLPAQNQIVSVVAATIWVIAVISLIVLLVNSDSHKLFRDNIRTNHTLNAPSGKPLYIEIKNPGMKMEYFEHYQIFNLDFYWNEDREIFMNEPELKISLSNDSLCHLQITKEYYHFEVGKVPDKYSSIAYYNWEVSDSVLLLDKYYTSDDEEIYRIPVVKLTLFIPEGKTIKYSDKIAELIISDKEDSSQLYAGNYTMKMTLNGLENLK